MKYKESADNFNQYRCPTIRNGLNTLFNSSHYKNPNTDYSKKDFNIVLKMVKSIDYTTEQTKKICNQ